MKKLIVAVVLVFAIFAAGADAARIFYVTPRGGCCHYRSCRTIRRACSPLLLEAALARGYRSCRICRTPRR